MMTNQITRIFRSVCALTLLVLLSTAALAGDPGSPIPQSSGFSSRVSDQARGFLLVYNVYTSIASNPVAQNTRLSITNTNDQFSASVHLFFVDGSTCSIADRYICLTPNQTSTFLAAEQDPGTTGYLLAMTTFADGFPAPFDYLIGDAFVKFERGFFGNLGAEAIASNTAFPFISADGSAGGVGIGALPRTLAVDNIGSRGDGNETLLVVNTIGGNYMIGANFIGTLFGLLFDDAETPHSWSRPNNSCQLLIQLSDSFPRTTPRFEVVIPTGQSGWLKFWSTSTLDNRPVFGTATDPRALLGAVFQLNSTATSSAGSFQGARNLHKLTTLRSIFPEFPQEGFANTVANAWRGGSGGWGTSGSNLRVAAGIAQPPAGELTAIIVPIFPPNCGFVDIF